MKDQLGTPEDWNFKPLTFKTLGEFLRQEVQIGNQRCLKEIEKMKNYVKENLAKKSNFPDPLQVQRYCLAQLNVLDLLRVRNDKK